jgi:DNA repair exonuclease SbcCD ATPase subunit
MSVRQEITAIQGQTGNLTAQQLSGPSLIPSGKQLDQQTFGLLTNETKRLKNLIGIDNENGRQFSRLSEKITKDEAELQRIKASIAESEAADAKIKTLLDKRKASYRQVFDAIIGEETELIKLYQPLAENLKTQSGSLGKLTFQVQRTADTVSWAERGEQLLDLRLVGEFKGKGSLLDAANTQLKNIWEKGTAADISEALAVFRDQYDQLLLAHAPVDRSNKEEFSTWANKLANWLYSTDHISINYGVQYEGVDIRQLSPGTRGIVLLLMYLAIDTEDTRPLIIDQPEENLDPKSIFDELVPLFRSAKKRRQIIIVTHNANLVVNTDAEQVIVAHAGVHRPGQLPAIQYKSGGLENAEIRNEVCAILEGGERAFRERAKRLRLFLK